jgi:ABC-type nickel/cobalt efflux system permease component RcnA
MKKLFLFLFCFQTFLHACATCQFMIPTAEVNLNLPIKENKLQKIEVAWHFSDLYTSELSARYDKNKNHILDKAELDEILKIKLAYLMPKKMLTLIKYGDENHDEIIEGKFENYKLSVLDERLLFSFDILVDIPIKEAHVLSFSFEDDESFFSFIVHEITIPKEHIHFEQNLYLFSAAVFFSYNPIEQEQNATLPQPIQEPLLSSQEESLSQESLLRRSIEKLKSLFEEADREHEPFTYLLILFFAYVYGLIHAIGPGHGKTLVASYFLSNDRSYSKAFFISLAIGVVHTFAAFLLTLVVYFVIETFLARFMEDTIGITTKISALIIIAIALYLFYKKYKTARAQKAKPAFSFSATPPHASSCGCGACRVDHNSTDAALIISAGIIPCPGTVTIFIFSLSMGLYVLGFLSALVMSLGMSTIIFASALLSVTLCKKTAGSDPRIKTVLEYLSLVMILLLGIVLFLS